MDIVVRAFFAFLFVVIVTRVIGRRELSSLQPFDLILLIVLGDLIQQGVTRATTRSPASSSREARSRS